ncbi:MAG: carbohydrate kinase family protein [Candidatus Margulisiibacteriota bacterium]
MMFSQLQAKGIALDMVVAGLPDRVRQDVVMKAGGPARSAAQGMMQFDENASVSWIGIVGQDEVGDWLYSHNQEYGMSMDRTIRTGKLGTSQTIGREQQGDNPWRNFIHDIGTNALLRAEELPDEDFDADLFHVGGNFLCPNLDLEIAFSRARQHKAVTSLDTVFDPDGKWLLGGSKGIQSLVPVLDVLIMDLEEAQNISRTKDEAPEMTLDFFRKSGFPITVIKMGKHGSIGYANGSRTIPDQQTITMPISEFIAAQPEDKKFPTGTGDIYAGLLALLLTRGIGLPVAMAMATSGAGLCLLQRGGELGAPGNHMQEVLDLYNRLIEQGNVLGSIGILPRITRADESAEILHITQ